VLRFENNVKMVIKEARYQAGNWVYLVRFEVFTAVTMKNAVFWDV
jgi:hypothetical protein